MNVVDIVVLTAIVLFAWSGWRNGFVSGLLSFIGFLGGGLIGVFLARWSSANGGSKERSASPSRRRW